MSHSLTHSLTDGHPDTKIGPGIPGSDKNEFKRNQLWQILLLLAGNPFGIFEKSEIRKLLEIDKYVTHILQMMTMMMMRGTHHDNAGRGKGDVDGGDANGKKSDLEKLT